MSRGEKRPGAGRSDGDIAHARELLSRAVTDREWICIFKSLAKQAQTGDRAAVSAAQLLMAYRFGLPNQSVAGVEDGPPIRIVNVIRDASNSAPRPPR